METAVTSMQDQLEEVDEGPAAADVPPPPTPREGMDFGSMREAVDSAQSLRPDTTLDSPKPDLTMKQTISVIQPPRQVVGEPSRPSFPTFGSLPSGGGDSGGDDGGSPGGSGPSSSGGMTERERGPPSITHLCALENWGVKIGGPTQV